MSGLIEKVKDKLGSSSRSRRSQEFSRSSLEKSTAHIPTAPAATSSEEATTASETRLIDRGRPVSSGSALAQAGAHGIPRKAVPPSPVDTKHPAAEYNGLTGRSSQDYRDRNNFRSPTSSAEVSEAVPDRTSSSRNRDLQKTENPVSRTGPQADNMGRTSMAEALPDRTRSRNDNLTGTGQTARHKSTRSQDIAPNDPSPLVPRFSNGASQRGNGVDVASRSPTTTSKALPQTPDHNEHLRLPADFDLGNSVQTQVDERYVPAVTHETIIKQRTEIIHKAITRDIHVHHYYTYVQPIKVVEVLPARHFSLDPKTGEKVEIAAPLGWMMPDNLQPHSPDYSKLQATERHYLVDEEYPRGKPEAPPSPSLKHKADLDDLSKQRQEI